MQDAFAMNLKKLRASNSKQSTSLDFKKMRQVLHIQTEEQIALVPKLCMDIKDNKFKFGIPEIKFIVPFEQIKIED